MVLVEDLTVLLDQLVSLIAHQVDNCTVLVNDLTAAKRNLERERGDTTDPANCIGFSEELEEMAELMARYEKGLKLLQYTCSTICDIFSRSPWPSEIVKAFIEKVNNDSIISFARSRSQRPTIYAYPLMMTLEEKLISALDAIASSKESRENETSIQYPRP